MHSGKKQLLGYAKYRCMLSALILAALLHLSCNSTSLDKNSWTTYLDKIGSSSSSRTADLNNDGVLDVVMGTGGKENFHCDTAVIAIDGATGKLLWKASADNQIVGSAIFRDINYDGVPDQDLDGLEDLIVANGGNPLVPPNDPDRPAGRLLVLSSSSGKILANVKVPDGRETYMSVVCL